MGISSWSHYGCNGDANGPPPQYIMKRTRKMCALPISHVRCEIESPFPPQLSLEHINLSCRVPQNVIMSLSCQKNDIYKISIGDLNIVIFITFAKITHCNFVCESLLQWRCYPLYWCSQQYWDPMIKHSRFFFVMPQQSSKELICAKSNWSL
jgi:hypothetical protein